MIRNAFAIRTSELSSPDELFARYFAPEVLEILPRDLFATSALVLRSSPGGGKTSLLRIFTPGPLLQVHRNQQRAPHDEIFRHLEQLGVMNATHIRAMGILIPCTNGYSELGSPEQDMTARGTFRALVNARIVLRALRAICMLNGLEYPSGLERISLGYETALFDEGTVPRPEAASELRQWAETVESRLLTYLDTLGAPLDDTPSHHSFDAVLWLSQAQFKLDGAPCEVRPIIMFDDVQRLRPGQRALLYKELLDHRSGASVWLAERTAVLDTNDIFIDAIQERDYVVVQLEQGWQDLPDKRFVNFTTGIADRRMRQMRDDAESFGEHLASTIDPVQTGEILADALVTLKTRAASRAAGTNRFDAWLTEVKSYPGDRLREATEWAKTLILIERDLSKRQASLDLEPLPAAERDARDGSGLPGAAFKFVSREFKLPYYFGIDRIARLSSYNVEEFLQICAVLYDHLHAARVARSTGPVSVSASDQDRALRRLADKRFREIPRAFPLGAKAQRLISAIGKLAQEQTFAPNAPYAPGVTGIGLSVADRTTLIKASRSKDNHEFAETSKILSACIAQNLFEVREVKQDSRQWTVLYLNRMLCVQFDLVYQTGGWRPTPISRLRTWHQG